MLGPVAAAIALVAPAVAHGEAWIGPSPISSIGEGAIEGQLAVTPQGDAISAWVSEKEGKRAGVDARIAIGSSGYGVAQPLALSSPPPGALKLATSADGTALLAWIQVPSIMLARRDPGASTFTVLPAFTPPGEEKPESLSVGFDGSDAYVLYSTFEQKPSETTRVRALEIHNGGSAVAVGNELDSYVWGPTQRWFVEPAPVVADEQHFAFAAWLAQSITNSGSPPPGRESSVRVAIRAPGGSFGAPTVADEASNKSDFNLPNVGGPALASGPGGQVTLAYPDHVSPSDNKLRLRSVVIGLLTGPEDVSVGVENVALAYDPAGALLVALTALQGAGRVVFAGQRPPNGALGGLAQVSPGNVSTSSGFDLTTGTDGSAAIAFSGFGLEQSVYVAMRPPGGAFGLGRPATPPLQFPESPQVALGGVGPRVQWLDGPSGAAVLEQAVLDAVPPVLSGLSVPAQAKAGTPVAMSVGAADALSSFALKWEFGDGSSAIGAAVQHTFAGSGTFTVRLTAIDAAGNSSTLSANITVLSSVPTSAPPTVSAFKVSAFKVSPARFAVSAKATALSASPGTRPKGKKRPRGSAFVLKLSAGARLVFTLTRRVRTHRHVRVLKVGTITRRAVKAGAVRVPFSGRLGRKKLRAGSYQVSVLATDASGAASRPASASFTILP